jgi:hypothetical protein
VATGAGAAWGVLRGACGKAADVARAAGDQAACAWALARPYRRPLLLALAVGTATGAVAFCAGPWIAAAAGWLAGFTVTLGVQAGLAFRRLVGLAPCA